MTKSNLEKLTVDDSNVWITIEWVGNGWFAAISANGLALDADGEGETPEGALKKLLEVVEEGGYH